MENKNGAIIDDIRTSIKEKKKLTEEIRTYLLGSSLEDLTVSTSEYSEYMDGLMIRDITSTEQRSIGATVLHIIAEKQIDFELHVHFKQSQTLSVIRGKILDLENNIEFTAGESFFVSRNKSHRLRYYINSELLVVYMPQLSETSK